jgi:hypothetical protein
MLTPAMSNRVPDSRIWAADNGCFSKPESFDPVVYFDWLARNAHAADRCLFATAPDIWGDGPATIRQSVRYSRVLRALGYKAAIVAQPGTTIAAIPWDDFDAIFIGGVDAWQQSDDVLRLIQAAKQQEKWVHRGRVNSLRRLRESAMMGCDSADGTFVAFAPDMNIGRLERWLTDLRDRPVLPGMLVPTEAIP